MGKRDYGTGHVYAKHGSYYGRWRTLDGRLVNRKLGPIRPVGQRSGGLTRVQAEREMAKRREEEDRNPRPAAGADIPTVDWVADSLRQRLTLAGARTSYRQNCESMQRVHISPRIGTSPVTKIDTAIIDRLASEMLKDGKSPKTVRNVLSFLHSIFEHAIRSHLIVNNPVRQATRPGRRRAGDANPDLQFLTVPELDAVLRAIPDEIVIREPNPTRRGRPGPAPPPPADVLGPVLRVLVLAAAMTGLRQSELLGLRWRDVDWIAQRIRVRNTYVRGEHSGDGKSDLSTKRSVPMADRLARELDRWSRRTAYRADSELVFGHPETGNPLDRSKVTKRFKAACRAAGVPVIKFHDLRHTFATRLAASGQPLRLIQEFMGHADSETTQIYAHYAPSEHEIQAVNDAFAIGLKQEQESDGNHLRHLRENADHANPELPA
jgi:integrase